MLAGLEDVPCEKDLPGGIRARFQRPSEQTVDAALEVVSTAALTGDGISREEVPTRHQFLDPPSGMAICLVVNIADDSIIAVAIRIHSPLCRSTVPVYSAGPFVSSPKYRGKGFGFDVMRALVGVRFASTEYRGFLGRAALTAPTRLQYKFTGGCNVGLIPGCTYLAGKGIIDDVICWGEIETGDLKKSWTKQMAPSLPLLDRTKPFPRHLRSEEGPLPKLSYPTVPFRSGYLQSKLANEADLWKVEELIRDCAESSDGFGIDEFTDEGCFNRALLRESHVVVFEAADGAVAAAVVFGPTTLCRSREALQVGGYLVVARAFRRQGLGRALVRLAVRRARQLGYVAILTDVFVENDKAARLLREEGFLITATLPNVAMLKHTGYTDSYLIWRSLEDIPIGQTLTSKV